MSESVWDCLVVGGGIVGSWTAYHLVKDGRRTLLLDQFMLPHTRGSSGGHSRIAQMAYTLDCYAKMMPEAMRWWRLLESDAHTTVFRQTGMLLIQHQRETGFIEETQEAMDKYSYPYTLLPPGGVSRQYPAVQYSSEYRGLLDPEAGVLLGSRCLKTVQQQVQLLGGVIYDAEKVEKIVPGSPVKVITSKGIYYAKKVVLAAGPWVKDLLDQLNLEVPIKSMPGLSVFFQEKNLSSPQYSADIGAPITKEFLYNKPGNYRSLGVFPTIEYPGMVKLVTRGEPPAYYCHPDERDTRGSQDLVQILIKYVKEHLPGLDPNPKIMEPCVYTMTPDRNYIIDEHPRCENIIIGAGFSGHGFCRAPVIGLLLMQLATGRRPSYDLDPFKLSRFKGKSNI